MIELIKPFNFLTFLDLYRYLQDSALAGEKEIRLERLERGKVVETLVLDLEYIKARSFEEIYPKYNAIESIAKIPVKKST